MCDCCGHICVEVKCPYLLKDLSFAEYIDENNSFLGYHKRDKAVILLEPEHSYYYQVQMRMHVTKSKFCYFVVWSPNHSISIKIHAVVLFWNENFPRAHEFHKRVVLPELLGRYFTKGNHLKQNWCLCNSVDDGRPMIKCLNDDCEIQWFHLNCIGLSDVPEAKWTCQYCPS
ncbi:unnamed protein product [Phaedon cochleariae]|uniref:PHD-type domain-containing protein n=1 Tax=Phaedon cochleariae TaxID=80249 RepID=A0A9N9SN19_PHACE|nr:unnamed protein product [Phaedon cochleariae]